MSNRLFQGVKRLSGHSLNPPNDTMWRSWFDDLEKRMGPDQYYDGHLRTVQDRLCKVER